MAQSATRWQFTQSIGDSILVDEPLEGDFVTSIEFSPDGHHLAVGDKAGRVRIYKASEVKVPAKHGQSRSSSKMLDFSLHTQFQSHEPEFDYLKSLEIEEKINMIKWCPSRTRCLNVLTTNDKTIKLWKVTERKIHKISDLNADETSGKLRIPTLTFYDTIKTSSCRRTYANSHAYHINSISLNSDSETYISVDDLRINLWNLEISNRSFNIVDIKPENMEELTEVITAAEFHPTSCNLLMYSSSRGSIRIVDLREKALCDNYAKVFEMEEDPADRSFFSEIIASISDVKFSGDGRYIVSRDYLTMKIWDIKMESQPVEVIPIHEYIRPRLCDLYESDFIFDKFECSASANGRIYVTGTYGSNFVIHDRPNQISKTITPPVAADIARLSGLTLQQRIDEFPPCSPETQAPVNGDDIDFNRKTLHVGWHPHGKAVAAACVNNIYLYQAL